MINILASERSSFLAKFPKVDAKRQALWDKGIKEVRAEIQAIFPDYIQSSHFRAFRTTEKSQTKCLN